MQTGDPDIYEEHVLDHYEDPYNRGALSSATHRDEGDNPMCGDHVRLDLEITDGVIEKAYFDGEGCVISQASASMLVEQIEGKSLEELDGFGPDAMLELFGPKLTPNRQKCCLLGWRVLQSAVHAPVDGGDDEPDDADDRSDVGPNFGGPSLGEEQ